VSAETITTERPTIGLDILRQFTKPDHETFRHVLAQEHYRGDLTQTGDDRLRLAMGDAAYQHYHWDTVACNLRVLLVLPRFKHPEAVENRRPIGLPAPWFWCLDQVERHHDLENASKAFIERVSLEVRESLQVLPGLEWVKIGRVGFFEHGRGKPKRRFQAPPDDVVFFQFRGGVGCAAAVKERSAS